MKPNTAMAPRDAGGQRRGAQLACLARGQDAELRVTLDEYRGSPYLGLRVWERGEDGQLHPAARKGCSVRLHEAGRVARALLRGAELAGFFEAASAGIAPTTITAAASVAMVRIRGLLIS